MTAEAQNLLIAQACEWKGIRKSYPWERWDEEPRIRWVGYHHQHLRPEVSAELPHYTESRDAMAGALRYIQPEEEFSFIFILSEIVGAKMEQVNPGVQLATIHPFKLVTASAAQLAQAFLKVKGLWNYSHSLELTQQQKPNLT